MPKKIDYLVVTPSMSNQNATSDTPEEEASRPRGGPRGRGRGRSGGARPSTGYRGPGTGASTAGGFRRGPGGPARPGGPGGAGGAAGGTARRGFGGMTRLAPLERQTPKVALPPYLTVQELAELMSIKPVEVI